MQKFQDIVILNNNNWILKGMIGCYFSTCIFTGKHDMILFTHWKLRKVPSVT